MSTCSGETSTSLNWENGRNMSIKLKKINKSWCKVLVEIDTLLNCCGLDVKCQWCGILPLWYCEVKKLLLGETVNGATLYTHKPVLYWNKCRSCLEDPRSLTSNFGLPRSASWGDVDATSNSITSCAMRLWTECFTDTTFVSLFASASPWEESHDRNQITGTVASLAQLTTYQTCARFCVRLRMENRLQHTKVEFGVETEQTERMYRNVTIRSQV